MNSRVTNLINVINKVNKGELQVFFSEYQFFNKDGIYKFELRDKNKNVQGIVEFEDSSGFTLYMNGEKVFNSIDDINILETQTQNFIKHAIHEALLRDDMEFANIYGDNRVIN